MVNQSEESNKTELAKQGVKTTASTVAGASLGVTGGIALVTAAAAAEIVLPVALCLWTVGLAGGAVGLLFGMPGKKKAR